MNSKEIFFNLTRGVNFAKRKNPIKNEINSEVKIKKIKEEQQDNNQEVDEFDEINESNYENDLDDEDEVENNNKSDEDEENKFEFIKTEDNKFNSKGSSKKKKLSEKQKKIIQEQEELNVFRKTHKINVIGKNVPAPIRNFDMLLDEKYNVPQKLVNNLLECGFTLPTPIQMQAIPIMLEGRPVMACAPTGSGKTVAFLTPIVRDLKRHKKVGFRAIILCPTRELAKQTYRECLRLTDKTRLRMHVISKIKQIDKQYESANTKKYDILISTPNRVRFLLQHDPPLIDLSHIKWFIIDEADKLLEDGKNNFKEQFDDIWLACTNENKKMGLFSATYTIQVAKWALKNLKNLIRVTIGERNSATSSVEQELLFVGNESGKLLAIRDMVRTGLKPPVLIFVQSKERAKQLFSELLYDGINVEVIHADRSQQQRDNCIKSFREGKIWVLICTDLMGRGIDFKGVNLVVNYDFPPSTIAYIHRVGRTGRAGRPGKAITFFTQDDQPNLRSIAHIIKKSGGNVPEFMLTLKKPKKSDKKKLENHAPKRDDILTTPKFVLEKRQKFKENLKLEKSAAAAKTTEKILKPKPNFKEKRLLNKTFTKKGQLNGHVNNNKETKKQFNKKG